MVYFLPIMSKSVGSVPFCQTPLTLIQNKFPWEEFERDKNVPRTIISSCLYFPSPRDVPHPRHRNPCVVSVLVTVSREELVVSSNSFFLFFYYFCDVSGLAFSLSYYVQLREKRSRTQILLMLPLLPEWYLWWLLEYIQLRICVEKKCTRPCHWRGQVQSSYCKIFSRSE